MKRGYLFLAGTLALATVLYLVVYFCGISSVHTMSRSQEGELEWLRREFQIDDAGFSKVLALHRAHVGKCTDHCLAMDQSKSELLHLAQSSQTVTPEMELALRKASEVREQCRLSTLQYIYDVSQCMRPDQGRRYREMMTARLFEVEPHYHMAVSENPGHSTGQAH